MENQITFLFEKIADSDLSDKKELRFEAIDSLKRIFKYFSHVVSENIYYCSTSEEERTVPMVKAYDKERRSAHDECLIACSRLNEICTLLEIEEFCRFDTTDRRKVAQFCGYISSLLYFTNLAPDKEITDWLIVCPASGSNRD